jgi:hypothetical protein
VAETFLAGISVQVMRGELRRVAAACTSTLAQCLAAEYARVAANIAGGQVVSATSANAHSVSFSEPGKGSASPQSWAEMWSAMLDLYDKIVAALPADPAPTDADILKEMMFALVPARTVTNSFAGLRCA